MRIFLCVVERGSFSGAAEVLHLQPSKVSTHVAALEKHVGVRLLNRTTRSVIPTSEGRAYQQHCLRVLADVDKMHAELAEAKAALSGEVRIDAAQPICKYLLLPLMPTLFQRHPAITITFVHSGHLFEAAASASDLLFRAGQIRDSAFIARPIGSFDRQIVASPAYLERHGEPRTLDDLRDHNCLNFVEPHTGHVLQWSFSKDGRPISRRVAGNLAFDDPEMRVEAAVEGFGIVNTLSFYSDHHVRAGRLVPILRDWETRGVPIWLMYPRDTYQPAKVRAVIDFLSAHFRPAAEPSSQ